MKIIIKTDDAIKEFGGQKKLADALGIKQSAVAQWGEDVPQLRAYQVAILKPFIPRTIK